VRGNIDSRLRKLESGEYDAILLAAAGLSRMGWQDRVSAYLPPEVCLPAVGQGALGIECRADDADLRKLLALYNDADTALTVAAERTFLGALNGGCQVPIGAHAVLDTAAEAASAEASGAKRQLISLTGMVGTPDGSTILKETCTGVDPVQLGEEVAKKLIARGAEKILSDVRG
jgi:hydroxymethylbilane synthase